MRPIRHESAPGGGAFRLRDEHGVILAELTYRQLRPDRVSADRTFVDPSLRGQGIAAQLLGAVVERARAQGWTIAPACSYVARARARSPELRDVIEGPATPLS